MIPDAGAEVGLESTGELFFSSTLEADLAGPAGGGTGDCACLTRGTMFDSGTFAVIPERCGGKPALSEAGEEMAAGTVTGGCNLDNPGIMGAEAGAGLGTELDVVAKGFTGFGLVPCVLELEPDGPPVFLALLIAVANAFTSCAWFLPFSKLVIAAAPPPLPLFFVSCEIAIASALVRRAELITCPDASIWALILS